VKTVTLALRRFCPLLQSSVPEMGHVQTVESGVDFGFYACLLVFTITPLYSCASQLVHLGVTLRTERDSDTSNGNVISLLTKIIFPLYRSEQFPVGLTVAVSTCLGHVLEVPSHSDKSQGGDGL